MELHQACTFYAPEGPTQDESKRTKSKKQSTPKKKSRISPKSDEELFLAAALSSSKEDLKQLEQLIGPFLKTAAADDENAEAETATELARRVMETANQILTGTDAKLAHLPQITQFSAEIPLLKIALVNDNAADSFIGAFHDHDPAPLVHTFDGASVSTMSDIEAAIGGDVAAAGCSTPKRGLSHYLDEAKNSGPKKAHKGKLRKEVDAYFIFTKAEHLKEDLVLKFASLIQHSGLEAAVVLIFRGLASATENWFHQSSTIVHEQHILLETPSSVDELLFNIMETKKLPFMLGPQIVSFLMDSAIGYNDSPRLFKNALTSSIFMHYTTQYIPLERLGKSAEIDIYLEKCRSLPSFIKYLRKRSKSASEKVELLLDDKLMADFIKKSLVDYRLFQDAVILTTIVIWEILSAFVDFAWWKCYERISAKLQWNDCPELHENMQRLESPDVVQALNNCLSILEEKKNKSVSCASAMEKSIKKYIDSGETGDKDALLTFRMHSKKGPMLISLLEDLCRHVKHLDEIIFHEVFIFDNVSAVKDMLVPDIKATSTGVLGDPVVILETNSRPKTDDGSRPDICAVFKTLKPDRRLLDLGKSCAGFINELRSTSKERDENSFEPEARARFIACLPALQRLGILALAEKGRKRTYSIV